MTDRGRLTVVRLILIVTILRSTWFLLAYQSGLDTGLVLGRYTPRYLAILIASVIVLLGLGIFLFLPVFKRLVLADQTRTQWLVLGGWLTGAPLTYALVYWLVDTARFRVWWNGLAGILFPLLTLALIFAGWNALRELIRRPEFYLALFSAVVGLVLVEVGVRTYINRVIMPQDARRAAQYLPSPDEWRDPRFVPHHYALYILNPLWQSEDGLDQINSLGFRGEEVSVPKPPGVFRIVAMGGSTTYGTGVERWQDSYPAQLEQVLVENYGYTNVEVVNAGVGGQNSWEALVNLEFRVLDLQPDLVILYQNTNDVHARLVKPDTYRGDNSGERTVWDPRIEDASHGWWSRVPSALWRFVGLNFGWFEVPSSLELEDFVTRPCTGFDAFESCMGVTPSESLAANPPIYYERNIRNMIAIAEANGADFLLVSWAYSTAYHDYSSWDHYQAAYAEQNEVMKAIADETGVFFYDFARDMPTDIDYWVDGRHLNQQGNRLKAELISASIHDAEIIPNP